MICKVIVDISNGEVDRIFDYVVPDGLEVNKGDRVLVPFGNKKLEGFCIDTAEKSDYDLSKLKPVISKLDEFSCISEEMLALITLSHINELNADASAIDNMGKTKEYAAM